MTTTDPMFSPVAIGRASTLIVDQVRELIRDGKLSPGDRLPSERELGERFGVSRVTVREALRGLEASGLISIKVGARGGAFVTAPTGARLGEGIADLLTLSVITPAEVTETRQVFELGLVPVACERATAEDIAALVEICDRAETLQAEGGYAVELSAEFHVRLAAATHNTAVELLARSLHGPMQHALRTAHAEDPAAGQLGLAEHRELVAALADRDADRALAVMRRHLARTAERLAG